MDPVRELMIVSERLSCATAENECLRLTGSGWVTEFCPRDYWS